MEVIIAAAIVVLAVYVVARGLKCVIRMVGKFFDNIEDRF